MARYRFEEIAYNSTEKKKPVEEDKYTYLGLEHLDSGSLKVARFGTDTAPKGEKLIMHKGDVLFGKRRAYQKKVAIAPFDGIFSAHGMVLRPKEEVIDKDFFPLFISSDYFLDEAIKISVGSLSPTINWRDLKELEFELPGLEEQKRLAEVLWAIRDTLEAYKKLLVKTDELVKARFVEMFASLIDVVSLSYYIKALTAGKSLAGEEECANKVLKTSAVTYDYFDSTQVKNLPIDYEPEENHQVKVGDVIISRMNTPEFVGAAAYVWKVPPKTYLPDRLWRAEIYDTACPIFVWQTLIQKDTKDKIRSIASGTSSSMKNISKLELLGIQVKKVDLTVQTQFAAFVQQTDKSKQELKQAITDLEATYKQILFNNLT